MKVRLWLVPCSPRVAVAVARLCSQHWATLCVGKRVAETMCYSYQQEGHVEVRVARIFNTFGPRMHPNDGRVVSNFIIQVRLCMRVRVGFVASVHRRLLQPACALRHCKAKTLPSTEKASKHARSSTCRT